MIESINKSISNDQLDEMIKELETRPEMMCTGNICGLYLSFQDQLSPERFLV